MDKAIKELVDTVDIFDTSNIDDIIDKINAVGCTSFMFTKAEIEQMCKDGRRLLKSSVMCNDKERRKWLM